MKKIFFSVLAVIVVIQFFKPQFTNPNVDNKIALHADEKVMVLLKQACYDCHSNETIYPWYHNIAPVSWVMKDHIDEGREAINFSTWANINADIRLKRIKRAKQLVDNGLMPLGSYAWMHKVHLNQADKETLDHFFDQQIEQLKTL